MACVEAWLLVGAPAAELRLMDDWMFVRVVADLAVMYSTLVLYIVGSLDSWGLWELSIRLVFLPVWLQLGNGSLRNGKVRLIRLRHSCLRLLRNFSKMQICERIFVAKSTTWCKSSSAREEVLGRVRIMKCPMLRQDLITSNHDKSIKEVPNHWSQFTLRLVV